MPSTGVVIVGAGPAGCAAAVQCARLGLRARLLDRTGEAGGLVTNAWRIENYPGLDPLSGEAFRSHLHGFLDRFGIPVQPEEVRSIERTPELIVHGRTGSFTAACIIVATGTIARRPDINGIDEDRAGVFFEVRNLLAAMPAPGHVGILGGGEAACDYALNLAERGWTVSVLLRDDALRARGRLAALVREHPAIGLRTRVRLLAAENVGTGPAGGAAGAPSTVGIPGTPNASAQEASKGPALRLKVAGLDTAAVDPSPSVSDHLRVDALLVATGRESAAPQLLGPAGLEVGASIHSDDPGILVAGDARAGALGQIGMAVGDGLAAALAAADLLERAGMGNRADATGHGCIGDGVQVEEEGHA